MIFENNVINSLNVCVVKIVMFYDLNERCKNYNYRKCNG